MRGMKFAVLALGVGLYACEIDEVLGGDTGAGGAGGGETVDAMGGGGTVTGDGAMPDPDGALPDPDGALPDPDGAAPDPDGAIGPERCGQGAPNELIAPGGLCGPDRICDVPAGRCDGEDLQGICLDRPDACPEIFRPVCGCDGETYANDCERLRAGVQKDHDGECPPADCGSHRDCPGGVCEFAAGTCDEDDRRGRCLPRPAACPLIFEPVCGCDGVTYDNDCRRIAAGAAKDHDGACEGEPGLCRDADDCADGEFCACQGACGAGGRCEERPQFCPQVYAPVCGCDGRTYGNACTAAAAAQCIAHEGECERPPEACGGIAGVPCPEGELCDLPEGQCGGADLQGACVPRPDACLRIYQPVCGCDGETYGNDCERIRAGVQKEHDGECRQAGCEGDADCERRDFCEFDAGSCGEPAGGECALVPEICPRHYAPVCGCDGRTYGNDCERQANRAQKAHDGPCPDEPRACRGADDCERGEVCECDAGCGEGGICRPRPERCIDVQAPVCGCDGETYDNDCLRLQAGTCKAHDGACREAPCGVRGGAPCEDGEVCDFPGGRCEVADLPGACVDRPQRCPDVYDPVCGCDGVTYGNDCERLRAGAQPDHDGACEDQACDGPRDCDEGQFCECARGCGVGGACAPRPELCPRHLDPVCGCDGNTYNNDCERQRAGTCLEHGGACRDDGACESNRDCGVGEMCELGRGECGGEGRCVPRPEACILVYDPVCGCDGETYGNDCVRRAAGVAFASDGPCEAPPERCLNNRDCPDGFCECAGACGAPGVCAPRPDACPDVFDPVCGCDGNTYGNDCERRASGTCKAHDGACELVQVCGGIRGIPCPRGETCELPAGMCGGADLEGRCVPQPDACPRIYAPVCGCDGVTYGNDCERVRAGAAKDHDGECAPDACAENADCARGAYCNQRGCEGDGVCAPRPDACILVFDPVCGCDGETYGNSCEAAAAGMNVAHDGPCVEPPQRCEGDAECARGQFCECAGGICGGAGVCADVPRGCPDVFDPVCGCDGRSYGNDCERQTAGVCKEHDGECVDEAQPCAGNRECNAGQFCECGAGGCGVMGVCEPRPELCILIFDPVCGCDGNTYANDCERQRGGTCQEHEGPCEAPPAECNGNGDCGRAQYCAAPACGEPGVCQERPQACPDVFDPVCGCDGETYGNVCEAAAVGVVVAHEGACPPPRCEGNADCDEGDYCVCREACGAGVCDARPAACPDLFAPVCGCDGQDYGNACEAAAAGTCVEHQGECEAVPEVCVGNGDCARGEYCATELAACGEEGVCRPRPAICPLVFAPVCGCDGNTYDNACVAASAGTSVGAVGACRAERCLSNRDCGDAEYCECAGECGGGGECAPRPQLCNRVFQPVCGCDGVTYPNDCERRRAGVCLVAEGECVEPPQVCNDNAGCDDGSYCRKDDAACGAEGVCLARPEICIDVFDPVCACDGRDYGNACEAARAGQNVANRGACPDVGCRDNVQCGRDQFCEKPDGQCAELGECSVRPRVCPLVFAPVCGCDGETYGNDCVAGSAGSSVAHEGPCEAAACGSNRDCGADEFCNKPLGECGGDGECRARAEICPDVRAPVCGCDGVTYGNACEAGRAGAAVEHEGVCRVVCRGNGDCRDGQFCAKPAGECAGDGVCADRPRACIDLFDPVCGCDGNTHGNSCEAAAAGSAVEHAGECEVEPAACNERVACGARNEFCECAAGQCGGDGACVVRPELCAEIFRPVCGCDGNTYGNDCERQRAGTCLLHQGECAPENACASSRDCADGAFCECEGNRCGAGMCLARPEVCPRHIEPVCGCDGREYSNDCVRRAAGVCQLLAAPCPIEVER